MGCPRIPGRNVKLRSVQGQATRSPGQQLYWKADHGIVGRYINMGHFTWPNRLMINTVSHRTLLNLFGKRTDVLETTHQGTMDVLDCTNPVLPLTPGFILPMQPFVLVAEAGTVITYTFFCENL